MELLSVLSTSNGITPRYPLVETVLCGQTSRPLHTPQQVHGVPVGGVLNTHIQPTHSLRAWICWCAWDLIISIPYIHILVSIVCILLYDVYNATPACIIYSYSCVVSIACVHTSTLVLLPRLFFSVYVYHTYLYTYLCMCTCVLYSTRSVPPYGTLPHLTHLHVRSQVYIQYTQ